MVDSASWVVFIFSMYIFCVWHFSQVKYLHNLLTIKRWIVGPYHIFHKLRFISRTNPFHGIRFINGFIDFDEL